MKTRRGYKDLSLDDKAAISKDRLLHPDLDRSEFAERHSVTPQAITELEQTLSFSKEVAEAGVLATIMEQDNELMRMSVEIKKKFAEQVGKQRTLKSKDVEVLDKLEQTVMKRAAIVSAEKAKQEKEDKLVVTVNL